MKPICLKCEDDGDLIECELPIEQTFKGEEFIIDTLGLLCQKCGWKTLGQVHVDPLRRMVADAYRSRHGLLTSSEIVGMRKTLKMNQRKFAEFLEVGEASVKRWETWLVQETSSDALMRLKFRHEKPKSDMGNPIS